MNAFDFYRSKNLISISLYPFAYRGGWYRHRRGGNGCARVEVVCGALSGLGCRLGLPLREARFWRERLWCWERRVLMTPEVKTGTTLWGGVSDVLTKVGNRWVIRRQEVTKQRLAYKQFPLTIARYRVLAPLVDQNEPARFFSFSERNCWQSVKNSSPPEKIADCQKNCFLACTKILCNFFWPSAIFWPSSIWQLRQSMLYFMSPQLRMETIFTSKVTQNFFFYTIPKYY